MKTCDLSLATVVLGALAVAYSACSAQGQDNSVPGGSSVSHAAGNTSGSSAGSNNASGGAPPFTGAAGSPFVPPGSGGRPTAAGGGFNTGVGGATTSFAGRPGTGTGGTATGSSGAPATDGCQIKMGIATEVLIDDLEDGDNVIRPIGNRTGYWYTFNDGTTTGMQTPAPSVLFKGTSPGSTTSPMFAATTSGSGFTGYGAGMGFDFNNTASKACPYDASAYKGITFWAKGNAGNMTGMTLKAMIKIPATTPVAQASGACPKTSMCEDHFALKPAPALTTAWTKYTITFAAPTTFAQEGFGTVATFDKSKIIAMQFQVAKSVKFDFSIDDLAFF
ncbi:MAG TPA: hypothetical protein VFK05_25515 [Polyangiaceae bacterium]|nr:hypothetical protein [Polyangiaceae bacterium]